MPVQRLLWFLFGLIAAVLLIASTSLYFGVVTVAATEAHSWPARWLLHAAMVQSVRHHAGGCRCRR